MTPDMPVTPAAPAMDPTTRQQLIDLLQTLLSAAPALAPPPDAPYPHIVKSADGVNIMAKAPLNPQFRTAGGMTWILGSQPGTNVFDPSNGDQGNPPQPLRSPAGFPLHYSFVKNADGTTSMIGTPTVLYGDHFYNNDAEVTQAIAAWQSAQPDPTKQKADWDALNAKIKARTQAQKETPL